MTDKPGSHWYFREDGAVTMATWAVTDPTRFHTENALAKTTRGEDLSDAESAAYDALKAAPTLRLSELDSADARLALVALTRRDILETLDRFATELGDLAGPVGEIAGWQLLEDYCGRALGVTMEEAGIGGDDDTALERLGQTETPERIEEIRAAWARSEVDAAAWADSPEGQAAAAAMGPDDGPEGWSLEPPRNPMHPILKGPKP